MHEYTLDTLDKHAGISSCFLLRMNKEYLSFSI